jgi:hypothetical protein
MSFLEWEAVHSSREVGCSKPLKSGSERLQQRRRTARREFATRPFFSESKRIFSFSFKMTDIYNKVSQLIPGCLLSSYKTIELTILGSTVDSCSTPQMVLLWISVCLFTLMCIFSSLIADSNVVFIPSFGTWLTGHPTVKLSPVGIHTVLATVAFLSLIFFNPPTFTCLFTVPPASVIVQTVPILMGTLLLTAYTMLFSIPPSTPVLSSP